MRKVITISNLKGGVGKSTVALHLAAYLSQHGETLLIDYDPTNRTCEHWAEEGKLSFAVTNEKKASRVLSDSHHFVVIDSPARPDDLKDLAESCDLLILPTLPNIVSINPTIKTAIELSRYGSNHRVLINCVAPYPSKEGERLRAELREAELPVFEQMLSRSSYYERAALEGVPVNQIADTHKSRYLKLWRQIESLGDEILEAIDVKIAAVQTVQEVA